ncbi:MAG: TerB family tellurite resistance protein [Candidatus Cloacimonetes bacterium]|nr:TerB family tellurite resistance protein [Candidatus Cloacimonadota bacterium]
MNKELHPLSQYSEIEKASYLSVVAAMMAADGEVCGEELSNLITLCKEVNVTEKTLGKVITIAEKSSPESLIDFLKFLSTSDLRFTLITDIIFMAYADNKITSQERLEVNRIAEYLNVNNTELSSIWDYIEAVINADMEGKSKDKIKFIGKNIATELVAAAIAVSLGLSSIFAVKLIYSKID